MNINEATPTTIYLLQSNRLEYLDFADLTMLRFLDLSDNHLSSIHGLQTCENLLELNLDENRIARIGTNILLFN